MILHARGHTWHFPPQPLIMGIVNLSPDSFSGDGHRTVESALAHAQQHVRHGAHIIDLGAESARTNRPPIPIDEETQLLLSFIRQWQSPVPLSINTWRTQVIRNVLPHGGHILNDISGLPSPEHAQLCARHHTALLIMHTVGQPKVPHTHIQHPDILHTLTHFFQEKITLAREAGLPLENIIIDPGLDFAKQHPDNLTILRHIHPTLTQFQRPILLPISRKTLIGETLNQPHPPDRDPGTIALLTHSILHRAHILRVHNTQAAVQSTRILQAILQK